MGVVDRDGDDADREVGGEQPTIGGRAGPAKAATDAPHPARAIAHLHGDRRSVREGRTFQQCGAVAQGGCEAMEDQAGNVAECKRCDV